MGSRLVKYEFSPKENEQIEAVIKVPEETRSVIHGVVIDCRNRPIKDAVVKLLEVIPGNPCRMKPLTHTFTDNCGQFLFGPLHCNKKYALKVWYSDVKIRELIISPDCDDHCDDDHYDDGHSDDYRDGHHDRHYDVDFDDFFGGHSDDHSDDQCEKSCDDHCDDHDCNDDYDCYEQRKEDNRHERRRDEKRRDRHSDDDNYIHYRAPKVYGQKCKKCEIGKKVNNFEDIEK